MANERKWHGDAIAAEIERAATIEGMEAVAADFVRTAHPKTPIYQGFLRRSTKWDTVKRPRRRDDCPLRWGASISSTLSTRSGARRRCRG